MRNKRLYKTEKAEKRKIASVHGHMLYAIILYVTIYVLYSYLAYFTSSDPLYRGRSVRNQSFW